MEVPGLIFHPFPRVFRYWDTADTVPANIPSGRYALRILPAYAHKSWHCRYPMYSILSVFYPYSFYPPSRRQIMYLSAGINPQSPSSCRIALFSTHWVTFYNSFKCPEKTFYAFKAHSFRHTSSVPAPSRSRSPRSASFIFT